MNATRRSTMSCVRIITLAFVAALTLTTNRATAQIPDEDLARIREAIPTEPSVRVFKPRRLLIFTLCRGFRHSSIPYGVEAIKLTGQKTGAYVAEASEDINVFKKENLSKYDGVLFLSSTGTLFDDDTFKTNLLDFVKSGKGIIGIHAATDCFYDWEEFGRMMGGYFDGHPWNANTTVTLKIEEPDHPVCAAFPGRTFTITDEIYQLKDPYSRSKLRILTSLDTDKTDMTLPGIKRTDGDFAVSWVRNYGEGRVFYCSLGHREDIFWNPTVLRHYLDGIQFALGDLQAPAVPRDQNQSNSSEAQAALPTSVRDALLDAAKYRFGGSRRPLSIIEQYAHSVVDDPVARNDIEQALLDLLRSDRATQEAREFACRQLALIGGLTSAPVLAETMHDPTMSEFARYALERIPGDAADRALIDALDVDNATLQIGVINSLGRRRSVGAVEVLIAILRDSPTSSVRIAAADALASIGDQRAAAALDEFATSTDEAADANLHEAAMQSLLRLVDRFAEQGRRNQATSICESLLLDESTSPDVRIACIYRLATFDKETAFRYIIRELAFWRSDDEARAAAAAIERMDQTGFLQELNEAYSKLETDPARLLVIQAVGRRAGTDAGTFLMRRFYDGSSDEIVEATVNALGDLGMGSAHMILAQTAAERSGALREAARASLYRLNEPSASDADRQIARRVESRSVQPAWRAELLRALGVRQATNQMPSIFVALQDTDAVVRTAAWGAMGQLADASHLVRLMARFAKIDDTTDASEITAAGNALEEIAGRLNASGLQTLAELIDHLIDDLPAATQARLLPVLARTGTGDALATLIRFYRQTDSEPVRTAAVGALAAWPTAAAADTLYAILAETDNPEHRKLAFRGYIDVTLRDVSIRPKSAAALFARLMPQINSDDEARAAIRALSKVAHPDAIALVQTYLTSENLQTDAAEAMLSIASAIANEDQSIAKQAVNAVLAVADGDTALRKKAGNTLDRIEQLEDFSHRWVYSGPYKERNVGGGALIDVAFAPEPGETIPSSVTWKPVPPGAVVDPGFVDILQINPDSDACMYLKTRIFVPEAVDARLEIGSDDGVKVWLNDKVIHTNNVMRGMTIGEDVVNAALDRGWNTLMLKVTQGGGDWRASCRVRDENGFHIEGIKFETP